MKVGFTGTRKGMTPEQLKTFSDLMRISKVKEFHHGDCIGADAQAHEMMNDLFAWGVIIIAHPPKDERYRAWCVADGYRDPDEYLKRNHHIVDETECLVATPKHHQESIHSGTWATVRYARQLKRNILIINPDGTLIVANPVEV